MCAELIAYAESVGFETEICRGAVDNRRKICAVFGTFAWIWTHLAQMETMQNA